MLSATAIVGVLAATSPSRGNLDEIGRRVRARGGETSNRPYVERNSCGIETGHEGAYLGDIPTADYSLYERMDAFDFPAGSRLCPSLWIMSEHPEFVPNERLV